MPSVPYKPLFSVTPPFFPTPFEEFNTMLGGGFAPGLHILGSTKQEKPLELCREVVESYDANTNVLIFNIAPQTEILPKNSDNVTTIYCEPGFSVHAIWSALEKYAEFFTTAPLIIFTDIDRLAPYDPKLSELASNTANIHHLEDLAIDEDLSILACTTIPQGLCQKTKTPQCFSYLGPINEFYRTKFLILDVE